MSDEYYLAEAKATIDLICKEAKRCEDVWTAVIRVWWFVVGVIAACSVLLLADNNWLWVLVAACEIAPILAISDARASRAYRARMYSEQMDRAIAWRDELQRRIRGF